MADQKKGRAETTAKISGPPSKPRFCLVLLEDHILFQVGLSPHGDEAMGAAFTDEFVFGVKPFDDWLGLKHVQILSGDS